MESISDTIRALRPHVPPETLRDVARVEVFLRATDLFASGLTFFDVVGAMLREIPGLSPEKALELVDIVADAQRRWRDLVPGARTVSIS